MRIIQILLSKFGKNKNLIDIIKVTLSNFATIISSVLVGFILPKILGVTDFGLFKTFTLYITYTGLLSFGFIEGVYLKYGGYSLEELDEKKFRFYSKVVVISQLLFSVICSVITYNLFSAEYRLIALFVSMYIFCGNINTYYVYISQITKRFDELSFRNVLRAIMITAVIMILYFLKEYGHFNVSYYHYTVVFMLIYLILDIWYMVTYRNITFGKAKYKQNELKSLTLLGLPLLFSNLVSTLLLTVDRQFVNITFDTDTYAVYAFAYNLLSLVTTATSAISTVIYPNLRKVKHSEYKKKYEFYSKAVISFVALSLCIYFPLGIIINWFLPKYHDSIMIFRIIFPGLILSTATQVVMNNFYKVMEKNVSFFVKSVVAIILSIVLDCMAYYIWGTTVSISAVSIISMLVWYLISEISLAKILKVKMLVNFIYIIAVSIEFYLITELDNYYLGFIMYIIAFLITTAIIYKKEISKWLRKSKRGELSD